MNESQIKVERMPTASYYRERAPAYKDTLGLHALFDAMYGHESIILVGPKGVGKSVSFLAWAHAKNIPMVTVSCSADLRLSRLIGGYTIRGDETPFVLGAIPTAIEIANEVGDCVINFEEINALTPEAQKILNPLTDFQRRIEVSDAGRVFEVQTGKKLWVVGSMNTTGYGGTHQLNEDLLSRVEIVTVNYPDPNDERDIVKSVLSDEQYAAVTKPMVEGRADHTILDGVLTLARETRQPGGLDYALAPRDVVRLLSNISRVGAKHSFQLLLGKYEGDSRVAMKKRIESTFRGVTLPTLPEERSA